MDHDQVLTPFEKVIAHLRERLDKEGASPELGALASILERQAHALYVKAMHVRVDIFKRSPIRLSEKAKERYLSTQTLTPVTTDIVEDLQLAIDRMNGADTSLLVGLGEIAARIEKGHINSICHQATIVELSERPQLFIAAVGWNDLEDYKTTDRIREAGNFHEDWATTELLPVVQKYHPEARLRRLVTRYSLD
jgi:hypothetical protein